MIKTKYNDVEVPSFASGSRHIVRHRDLVIAVKKLGFSVKYTLVHAENGHIVIECRMKTPDTRVEPAIGIGEVSDETIYTEEIRKYPYRCAYDRAFDRAAIDLLGFKEEVLSNSEWDGKMPKAEHKAQDVQNKAEHEAQDAQDEVKEEAHAEEEEDVPELPDGIIPDDEVILFGKCKDMTFGQAKHTKKFAAFLEWVEKHDDIQFKDARKQQLEKLRKLIRVKKEAQ